MHRLTVLSLFLIVFLAACSPQALTPTPLAPPETQPVMTATVQIEVTQPPAVTPESQATQPPTEEPQATQPPAETPPPSSQADTIAYVGKDGNVWLADLQNLAAPVAITQDALPWPSGGQQADKVINYAFTAWSSDGKYLAFQREEGIAYAQGYNFTYSLMVYEAESGSLRTLLENQQTAGFAFQPGTSLLTYALPVDMGYWTARGQVDASVARGIWAIDVTGDGAYELVGPKNGRHLVNPVWSPDGRFISFEEVLYMEGRGNVAYFDLRANEYIGLDEPLGGYDWSPDGETLVYDTQTYVANGTERIFSRPRQGGEVKAISPEYEPGYAHQPAISPQGDRVAFLAEVNGVETGPFTLFVVPIGGETGDPALLGRPQELGRFEQQAFDLDWSPDGQYVYLVGGPYPDQAVTVVNVMSGETITVAPGMYPAWRPVAP